MRDSSFTIEKFPLKSSLQYIIQCLYFQLLSGQCRLVGEEYKLQNVYFTLKFVIFAFLEVENLYID